MPAKRNAEQLSRKNKKRFEAKDEDGVDESIPSLQELSASILLDSSPGSRSHALYHAVEKNAVLRRMLWPMLVRNRGLYEESTKQASQLLATLVTWEQRDGVNLDTALDFVEDKELSIDVVRETWEMVLGQVLTTVPAKQTPNFTRLAEATYFLNICCTVAQLNGCNLSVISTLLEKHVASISIWHYIPSRIRDLLLRQQPDVQWTEDVPGDTPFVVTIIRTVLQLMEGERLKMDFRQGKTEVGEHEAESHHSDDQRLWEWTFLHRALELLIDLLLSNVWSTRRVLVPYLEAINFSVRGRLAIGISASSRAHTNMLLTQQLLERLDQVIRMNIDPTTGTPLNHVQVRSFYHTRASTLQKMCQRHFSQELPDVIFAGVGSLCSADATLLRQALGGMSDAKLVEVLHKMRLLDSTESHNTYQREFLLQVLQNYLTIPDDPVAELLQYPLYPTEQLLWNFNRIPPSHPSLLPLSHVLDLPKLRFSFLSFSDYLGRCFELMRLESAFEIRSDLCDVLRRIRPVVRQLQDYDAVDTEILLKTEFSGWARMALQVNGHVEIKKVSQPGVGSGLYPAQVIAEFSVDLTPCGESIRREWNDLGEFDNLFLVAVDATKMTGRPAPTLCDQIGRPTDRRVPDEDDWTFPQRFGITAVRGCMILSVKDENGNVLHDPGSEHGSLGVKRLFTVALDPVQYSMDVNGSGTEVYKGLNLVMRRHGRENNFKAVLETIRGLMSGTGSINRVIPAFLQQVILGQGSPAAAHYKSDTVLQYAAKTVGLAKSDAFLDYGDTFINEDHMRSSFPGAKVEIGNSDSLAGSDHRRFNYRLRITESEQGTLIEAQPYEFRHKAGGNPVRFTPMQVEAIRSGLSPALSVVVGPPGTGKTDVAVQVISCLFHSFPNQRTVVITHSNAALNDIFEKVIARGDIEERSLLRLGSGERGLQAESSHDFTKSGRVAYCLAQRMLYLEKVQVLSESLGLSSKTERGVDGSPGYTCETAEYFQKHHVNRLVKKFLDHVKHEQLKEDHLIHVESFPFATFFEINREITLTEARKLLKAIDDIFLELAVYRPFELLRSHRQRGDYLLMKQTRVVAMTCTHAAICRSQLIKLGFEYDNVVIEEAGQMLEIEGFIPLLLQKGDADGVTSGASRLKRVCLLGDHNQLPPVIKNISLSKFSNLDQSLFTRLIRLGVPYTQLDRQGRARPEIASLYSWRYDNLGNLEHVVHSEKYQLANPGFLHTMQLINVDNFEGKGESSPTAYFYQNTGEAEYAVALFQFMVLIGHPPESISILTTYNGQKQLVEDILSQRCGMGTPLSGVYPRAVSTVDQYQGQQNDYVILSLVRTESVGHLRDVRRLIVAVSRARLGLYVLCRQSLFTAVHELKNTFDPLILNRTTKLQLVLDEYFPSQRKVLDEVPPDAILEIEDVTHIGSIVHQMQLDLVSRIENPDTT